uniref:J domain-containing protein n=1 Tax=Araucaria cunninghamii TaxID=56994 RepID=A0A0D6R5E8_ARACU
MDTLQFHFLRHSSHISKFPKTSTFPCRIMSTALSILGPNGNQPTNSRRSAGRAHCINKKKNEEIGSEEWLAKASPMEVLGLQDEDSLTLTEDDIKAAFRAKVKEFHPDVYKGSRNASSIVQHVIQAYEILMNHISQGGYVQRKSSDPFEEPECEALDIFVNELLCIGKGCLDSCVKRAPHAFSYASDTGCARAITQGQGDNYQVQLAVGQCPRNCIYYITPAQRVILEELLARALERAYYSTEASMLESLIAQANFENNRYQGSTKRNSKHSTKWVDWF